MALLHVGHIWIDPELIMVIDEGKPGYNPTGNCTVHMKGAHSPIHLPIAASELIDAIKKNERRLKRKAAAPQKKVTIKPIPDDVKAMKYPDDYDGWTPPKRD